MRKTLIGAVATAAALTLSLASPANAERFGIDDPAESSHGVDLLAVTVVNADRNLRVVLHHQNLRRSPNSSAGGVVYIDTDPDDKGPELVFTGGLFEGTDYALLRTEGFGPANWGNRVNAPHEMTLDYAKDTTRIKISRAALGADEVRVAVRVSGQRPDGTGVVDWMGKPRSFTMWLDRG